MRKTACLFSVAALFLTSAAPLYAAETVEAPVTRIIITDADSDRMAQNVRDFAYAVEHSQWVKVRSFLKEGVNPNMHLQNGDTPLTRALRYDDWKMVDTLLKSGLTDVTMENNMGETPLMLAVFKDRADYFDLMLKKGASVNKPSGWTPLHYAATEGRIKMIDRLLELGANVNAQTASGVTPLHMAARITNREAVMRLLRAGAYRDYCTEEGLSPADLALKYGDKELADFLAVKSCAVRGLKH